MTSANSLQYYNRLKLEQWRVNFNFNKYNVGQIKSSNKRNVITEQHSLNNSKSIKTTAGHSCDLHICLCLWSKNPVLFCGRLTSSYRHHYLLTGFNLITGSYKLNTERNCQSLGSCLLFIISSELIGKFYYCNSTAFQHNVNTEYRHV